MQPLPIAPTHEQLPTVHIAKPCSADWHSMQGDERSRFCGACRKHVYNLSDMTAPEAAALIKYHEGNLCVRYYLRADGTMMTQDCPVGLARMRQKANRRFAMTVVNVLAFALAVIDVLRTASVNREFFAKRRAVQSSQLSAKIVAPPKPADLNPVADKSPYEPHVFIGSVSGQ